MITEQDLQEAIAECQGVKNPNANTCIKLAAFLIIQDHLYGNSPKDNAVSALTDYSFAASPVQQVENLVDYYSDTEFSQAINGKKQERIWPVIEELMTVLQVTNPRLYSGVIRDLTN